MKTNNIKIKKHGIEYKIELEVEARNVIEDDDHQFISKDKLEELEKKPGTDDPVTNNTVAFTQAATRTNINSGETLSVMFGKIKKFFVDLKPVATSGSYNDLTQKPALKPVSTSGSYNDLTEKPALKPVATSGSYNDLTQKPALGTAAAKGVSNDLNVTEDGYVLDARQGKALNVKFGGLYFYEDATGKYVVGADSVPKKLGSGKIRRINLGNVTGNKSIDVKPHYADWADLKQENFALDGCSARKDGAQGQNNWSGSDLGLSWNATTGVLTVTKNVRGDPPYPLDLSSTVILFVSE